MRRKTGRDVLRDVCGLGSDESMTEVADGAISELIDAGVHERNEGARWTGHDDAHKLR